MASAHEPGGIDRLLEAARARLDRLSPRDADEAARAGGLIVDIRSEQQRAAQGLVAGAHFVPRNVLEWRADPSSGHHDPALADVGGPLILMCAQGFQSSLAAAALQDVGRGNATDMEGGFEAWREQGLPVLMARDRKDAVRAVAEQVISAGRDDLIDDLFTPAMARRARRWFEPFRASFPDVRMEVVELVEEGDAVVGRFSCSATHLGAWQGHEPTGRRFEDVAEVYFFRVEEGRIAEMWGVEDTASRLRQLGLPPP